jgi:hypothetical protein
MTRTPLRASLVVAALVAGSVVGGQTAAVAVSGRDTMLVSNDSHQFVTAEVGRTGDAFGTARSRADAPGPYEHFTLVPTGNPNSFYLWSNQAGNYVTAEFARTGDQRGVLRARQDATQPGPWETFFYVPNSDGTTSIAVYDSAGTRWYVSAENGWSGDAHGTLRARSTSVGPWERFVFTTRYVSGYDDLPSLWRDSGLDQFYVDPWGWNRECVVFAALKIYENSGGTRRPDGQDAPSDWASHSIDVNNDWGFAKDWYAYATSHNVRTDDSPTVGSIAQWVSNQGWFAAHGHVAVVTAVFPDGSITVSGYNGHAEGEYRTWYFRRHQAITDSYDGKNLPIVWPEHFIHVNGL